MNPIELAKMIPAKVRLWIYALLAAEQAADAVAHFMPAGAQARIAAVVVALGLGMAAGNVKPKAQG